MSSCCNIPSNDGCNDNHAGIKKDVLFISSSAVILLAVLIHFFLPDTPYAGEFGAAVVELLKTMWWGVVLGIVAVGAMSKIPKEYFNAILGKGDTFGGLLRAALAGLTLDLCSHGILMVGAKLYERGASLAQVMTFLIASPWNSISLTFILIALVGLKFTLVFIAGSAVIAIISGVIFQQLVKRGIFPDNPNTMKEGNGDFDLKADFKKRWKETKFNFALFKDIAFNGFIEGRMVIRWLFVGVIIAALIRAFVSTEIMVEFFGPTLIGLMLTLLATTVIEVCSEGSAPIGAELVNRAGAPGNGFVFLMAGVATDYTEIMVIREFTKKWTMALALPLITVPQVILIGWLINYFG